MIPKLIGLMIGTFPERNYVEHALKVYGYALAIGGAIQLSAEGLRRLEAAAILHDIGIPEAKRVHGSGDGPYQEAEGAKIAPPLLREAGFPQVDIDHITWLIGHHHSAEFTRDDPLLQVLMEADALVNLSEGNAAPGVIGKTKKRLFRTETGLAYLDKLFPPEEA